MWLPLDRQSTVPLIRQVYLALRQQILQGSLAAGTQLPPSRRLAQECGISRNVVLEAYDQLTAEGYLVARPGAGTYVAAGATWSQPLISNSDLHRVEPPSTDLIDFRSGIPALDRVPRQSWAKLARQTYLTATDLDWSYASPAGHLSLRVALVNYLRRSRGVVCQPDQIVITAGAAQALSLVARLLASSGDWVALEDPCPPEIRQIFAAAEVNLLSVPVDASGLQTCYLTKLPVPRFVLVTPSHQFPLGSVLTIQRRIELLEFARASDCVVIEDDYDSEFRYEGTPVSALQGLAPDRVIYIGTFSKILSPALRIGYLVLPLQYVEVCRELKRLSDLHNSTFDQLILAAFIETGQLEKHIIQMKKLYRQRRQVLRENLWKAFGDQVKISGDSTGLHLVAAFENIEFTDSALAKISKEKIKVYPVSLYTSDIQSSDSNHLSQIVLGYGNLSVPNLQTGIERLKMALSSN